MEIVLVTSRSSGSPCFFLEKALASKSITVKAVIFSEGIVKNRKKLLKRKLNKVLKKGPGVLFSGYYLRKIFDESQYLKHSSTLEALAKANSIPFISIERTNVLSKEDREKINSVSFSYGISVGNSYISSKIISLAKVAFLNIHHEILPEYSGAQSIIWQLYNKSSFSGYSIHVMNSKIDDGKVVYQEKFVLEFKSTLKETVQFNLKKIKLASFNGLVQYLENKGDLKQDINEVDRVAAYYTTPNLTELLTIIKNFNSMKKSQH